MARRRSLPSARRTRLDDVRTWVSDLDDTLRPRAADLLGQMRPLMARFLGRELGAGPDEAARLRDHDTDAHGTTLAGLVARHGTDPARDLAEVHEVDLTVLSPDLDLRAAIDAQPGWRIVFTNGACAYAERVLAARGLGKLLGAMHGPEAAGLMSKSDRRA